MSLFINDLFWTLQGEGFHAGRRALFVRMPHCNLRCSWCDTSFDSHSQWFEDDFKTVALEEPAKFAVVTGGEPTMHRHTPKIVDILKQLDFYVAVETNGTFAPNAKFDWITCSPKRDAEYHVHEQLYPLVNEFKYVVDKDFDFSVLRRHDLETTDTRLSLSPEFNDFNENVSKIISYIKQDPRWRLSLQTHKWIGVK